MILAGAVTATLTVTLNNLTEMLFEGNVPGVMIWLVLGSVSMLAPTWSLLEQRQPKPADEPRALERSRSG